MPLRFTVTVPGVTLVKRFGMGFKVGGSLTETTVRTNVVKAVAVPSLTVNVIKVVPKRFVAGVIVTVRLVPYPSARMFATGTRAEFVEVAVTVSAAMAVSGSPTVNGTVMDVSSFTDLGAMLEIVGGSFSGLTVKRKLLETAPPFASVTVMLMVEVPD